jgi:hypothetical protein
VPTQQVHATFETRGLSRKVSSRPNPKHLFSPFFRHQGWANTYLSIPRPYQHAFAEVVQHCVCDRRRWGPNVVAVFNPSSNHPILSSTFQPFSREKVPVSHPNRHSDCSKPPLSRGTKLKKPCPARTPLNKSPRNSPSVPWAIILVPATQTTTMNKLPSTSNFLKCCTKPWNKGERAVPLGHIISVTKLSAKRKSSVPFFSFPPFTNCSTLPTKLANSLKFDDC